MLAALFPGVALGSVGGERVAVYGAMAAILTGHIFSWRRRKPLRFLSLSLMLLFFSLLFLLRHRLLLLVNGDVRPLATTLLLGQALLSFTLQEIGSLRRSLILSGLTLILVSLVAVSLSYLWCVLAFVLLALSALMGANLANEGHVIGGWPSLLPLWGLSAVVILALSGALFLAFPRLPLLSPGISTLLSTHLEVASALPPPPPPSKLGTPSQTPPDEKAAEAPEENSSSGNLPKEKKVCPRWKAKQGWSTARSRSQDSIPARPSLTSQELERLLLDLSSIRSGDNALLMNVRSPLASYWRGVALEDYDGRSWSIASESGGFLFQEMPIGGAQFYYWQTFTMRRRPAKLLFAGYRPLRVFLPERKGETGYFTYRCLSAFPEFRPDELREDISWHPDPKYTRVPSVPRRVRQLAQEVISQADTDFDQALFLESFLRRNYSYGPLPPLPSSRESTDLFLFTARKGTCAQFASAMAVMARLVGLPARVVIGYQPGTYDLWSGTYQVHASDAHAWVEIYFRKHGWVPFDPTPPSPREASPSALLPFRNGFIRPFSWTHPLSLPRTSLPASGGLSPPSNFRNILLALLVLPLALLITMIKRRGWRKKPTSDYHYTHLKGQQREKILRLVPKLENRLSRQGFRSRRSFETIGEYLQVAGKRYPGQQELLRWLSEVISQAAYDPNPPAPELEHELLRRLKQIRL